jgi:hypothetical protein
VAHSRLTSVQQGNSSSTRDFEDEDFRHKMVLTYLQVILRLVQGLKRRASARYDKAGDLQQIRNNT